MPSPARGSGSTVFFWPMSPAGLEIPDVVVFFAGMLPQAVVDGVWGDVLTYVLTVFF